MHNKGIELFFNEIHGQPFTKQLIDYVNYSQPGFAANHGETENKPERKTVTREGLKYLGLDSVL